jgi:hypothetical protein
MNSWVLMTLLCDLPLTNWYVGAATASSCSLNRKRFLRNNNFYTVTGTKCRVTYRLIVLVRSARPNIVDMFQASRIILVAAVHYEPVWGCVRSLVSLISRPLGCKMTSVQF